MPHLCDYFVDFVSGDEHQALRAVSKSKSVPYSISDILERRLDPSGLEVFLFSVYTDTLDHATQLRRWITGFRTRRPIPRR